MFKQIAAGLNHSLVCTDGGTTFAFGGGQFGQLGNVRNYIRGGAPTSSDASLPSMLTLSGSATSRSKPLRIVQVAAGDQHSACITAGGLLYTWGLSTDGRLGHGKINTPIIGDGGGGCGGSGSNTQGNSASGLLTSAGSSSGTEIDQAHVQPRVVNVFVRTKKRVQHVSCGADHTLAIDDTSSAYSWGRGNYGALGQGDTRSRWHPIRIQCAQGVNGLKWSMVAAGAKHSLFLAVDGNLFTCGHGGNGRLGLGNTSGQLYPEKVTEPSGVKYRYVSAGEAHSAVVATSGSLYTFGCGRHGRLGHGIEEDLDAPTAVDTLQRVHVLQSACGLAHTVVLSASGELFSCGMAEQGQCGQDPNGATGETPNVTTPEKISMPHEDDGVDLRYIQVACGAYHTLAVDEEGNVRSFGSGHRGRLGHPAVGAEDGGGQRSGRRKNKGGLNLTLSPQTYHDMAKPQLIAALRELSVGGIMLQSHDSQWSFLRRALEQRDEATADDGGGKFGYALFGASL